MPLNPPQGSDLALSEFPTTALRMPALFVGHGSPMNAVEDNEFSRAWTELGRALPRPQAILSISAHWTTDGVRAGAAERPRTIYDFHGFPPELYQVNYPAPGSPALARLVQDTLRGQAAVELDEEWGLDHGAWSVLRRLFPQADIPVVQLSLDAGQGPAFHYGLGRALRPLRRRGILIVASGNIVHNLRRMVWEDTAYDWAKEFDETVKQKILSGDHAALINYQSLPHASLAAPDKEHFWPLLYVLGLKEEDDEVQFFTEKVSMGSMSMRTVTVG